MSEVKKIATRMSYGNALVELGKEHDDLLVFEADLGGATKTMPKEDNYQSQEQHLHLTSK